MNEFLMELLKIGGPPVAVILALMVYNRFGSGFFGRRKSDPDTGEPEERRKGWRCEADGGHLADLHRTFMRTDPDTGAIVCLQTWNEISKSQEKTAAILDHVLSELREMRAERHAHHDDVSRFRGAV